MSEPYRIICDFLHRFEPAASGRSAAAAPTEVRAKMHLFARGKLDAAGRQELRQALEGKPGWITAVADEVKALRPAGDGDAAAPPRT